MSLLKMRHASLSMTWNKLYNSSMMLYLKLEENKTTKIIYSFNTYSCDTKVYQSKVNLINNFSIFLKLTKLFNNCFFTPFTLANDKKETFIEEDKIDL